MENSGIRDVTVDHSIIKKGTICHISVIWDTEDKKVFIQSVRLIGNAITRFLWLSWQRNLDKRSLIKNK